MRTFETVAEMKLAHLRTGQLVRTKGYNSAGAGGGATYLIAPPQSVDGYGDHTLANSNVALLQVDGATSVKKFGATGDGVTDDTAACQAALDTLEHTYFPNGTYMIDPLGVNTFPVGSGSYGGLHPLSNTTVEFSKGAKLKALTMTSSTYSVMKIYGVNDVVLISPTIEGERSTHIGSTGEHGHCLIIFDASNIRVENAYCYDGWGDGITVGLNSDNVRINDSVFDNNRRQGASITAATDVVFSRCIFSNTNGTSPQRGVDVEADPGVPTEILQDIVFTDCMAVGNTTDGFGVTYDGTLVNPFTVTFNNCKTYNNSSGYLVSALQNTEGVIAFNDCKSENDNINGLTIEDSNMKVLVNGLHIKNPNQSNGSTSRYGSGISIYALRDNKVSGNLTARGVHVESDDGKALKSLTMQVVGGLTGSSVEGVDVEMETTLASDKIVEKTGADSEFTGPLQVKFNTPKVRATTGTLSSGLPSYVYQKITNTGATGALTINLNNADSVGTLFEIEVTVAQNMIVASGAGGLNILPGNVTSLTSNTIGSRLKIESNGINWMILEQIGTWT